MLHAFGLNFDIQPAFSFFRILGSAQTAARKAPD
jgi:hypothetical protein